MPSSGCIFKFAYSAKLLTLNAAGKVGIALDLLFATGYASNSEPFPGFASLGDTPMGIYCFSVNHCLAVTTIVVKIAHSLSGYFGCPHKSREEVGSSPDLGTKSVF